MNFGKLLKAASRLPAFVRRILSWLFDVLEQLLRSAIFRADQPDQVFAVLQKRGFRID
jgi:hypothetical protein